jgi:hypothetical protein
MEPRRTPAALAPLVDRLVADVRPVAPIWPPAHRLAVGVVGGLLVLGVAALASLRADVRSALAAPATLVQLALLALAATAAAGVALRAAVPGSTASTPTRAATALLVIGALAALALQPAHAAPAAAHALPPGPQCALSVLAFAALPAAALFAALRRGTTLHPLAAGAWAGAAACLLGVAATRIACPHEAATHLLAWHTLPVVVGVAAGAALGARLLAATRVA